VAKQKLVEALEDDMAFRIFELFTGVIADLPPEAILKVLDLECDMLEKDAKNHRPVPEDAFSIFYFREFVRTIKLGKVMRHVKPLPADHIEFFKKTIVRLVQANELPQAAMDQFDGTFAPDLIF
jgi:hypothetical protein